MDTPNIERFILHDYVEPEVYWLSSIWKVILLQGLRRSFGVAFFWLLAFLALMTTNVEPNFDSFITLSVLPIPIVAIASIIYYNQTMAKGPAVHAKHKRKAFNITFPICLAILASILSISFVRFLRFPLEGYYPVIPVLFAYAVMLWVIGFIIIFQMFGQLYKIYLIKRYCPYLKTPADAQYYKAEDEANSHET